jgi:hypothetical protein
VPRRRTRAVDERPAPDDEVEILGHRRGGHRIAVAEDKEACPLLSPAAARMCRAGRSATMGKLGLVVLGLTLVAGAQAADAGCAPVCGMQKTACLGSARLERLSCKASCRQLATPEERVPCARNCVSTFRTAKGTCRSDHTVCRTNCPPEGSCLGQCGQMFGQCAREATRLASQCRVICSRIPLEHERCMSACAMANQLGMSLCRTGFMACRDTCEGSPSGAFVDSSVSPF